MKLIKSVALVLAMMLTLASCSSGDTSYIAVSNDEKIPAGVYLYHMMNNLSQAAMLAPNQNKSPLDQTIEEKNGKQWILDKTMQDLKIYATVEAEFARLNLTIPTENETSVINAVNDSWENTKSLYEKNGISKDSVMKVEQNNQKYSALFAGYYGENGEKQVPEAELQAYYGENYVRTNYIVLDKYTSKDGESIPITGEALQSLKTEANGYFESLKASKDFEAVLGEREKAVAEQAGIAFVPHTHGDTNENFHDYILHKEEAMYPPEFITQLFGTTVGEAGIFENDYFYIIFLRKDINERTEDFTALKTSITIELKSENFEPEMIELSNATSLELNQASMSRYQPQKIKTR